MRVRPVARSGVYTQGASLLPSRVCRAAFIPATSLLLVSPIRLSRNVPAPRNASRAIHALLGFPSEPFKSPLSPPRHRQPPPR